MFRNIKISDKKIEKILSNCIELINRGYDLKYCETKYKKYWDILKDYLPVIERVKKLKQEDLSETFLKSTLNKIYEDSGEQDGIIENYNNVKIKTNRFHSFFVKPAIIFITLVLIFSFSLIGVLYASQDTIPNQRLYPVKRYAENVKLLITPESMKKILHFRYLNNRLNEAKLFFDSVDKEKSIMGKLIEEAEKEFEHLKEYDYFGDYTEEEIRDSIEKIKEESKKEFESEEDEDDVIEENTNYNQDSSNNNDKNTDEPEIKNDEQEKNNGKESDSKINDDNNDNKETEDGSNSEDGSTSEDD